VYEWFKRITAIPAQMALLERQAGSTQTNGKQEQNAKQCGNPATASELDARHETTKHRERTPTETVTTPGVTGHARRLSLTQCSIRSACTATPPAGPPRLKPPAGSREVIRGSDHGRLRDASRGPAWSGPRAGRVASTAKSAMPRSPLGDRSAAALRLRPRAGQSPVQPSTGPGLKGSVAQPVPAPLPPA